MDKVASPAATEGGIGREEAVWRRFEALMADQGGGPHPGADARRGAARPPIEPSRPGPDQSERPRSDAGAAFAPRRPLVRRVIAAALGCILALAAAAAAIALLGPPSGSPAPSPTAMTAPPAQPGLAGAARMLEMSAAARPGAAEPPPGAGAQPARPAALTARLASLPQAPLARWSRPAAPAALAEATIRLRHGGPPDVVARAARAIGETGATVLAQGGALAPPRNTEARYFRPGDVEAAAAAASLLGAGARLVDLTGYAPKPPPGVVEIWLGADD